MADAMMQCQCVASATDPLSEIELRAARKMLCTLARADPDFVRKAMTQITGAHHVSPAQAAPIVTGALVDGCANPFATSPFVPNQRVATAAADAFGQSSRAAVGAQLFGPRASRPPARAPWA